MTLRQIKRLVRNGRYDYSSKVRIYIENNFYTPEDLKACILSSTRIYKVEVDELGNSVDGCKYTIYGNDTNGYLFYTCGKVLRDEKGNFYFFITAHEP